MSDLKPDLPDIRVVFTDEERQVAEAAVAEAEEIRAKDVNLSDLLSTYQQRWENRSAALACYLYGDSETKRLGQSTIIEVYWDEALSTQRVLGLIAAAPQDAARVVFSDPHASMPLRQHLPALANEDTAAFFLEGLAKKTLRALSIDWMNRHPEYAARAWIPIAVGATKKKKAADLARQGLRRLASEGHEDALRKAAAHYGDEASAAIDALLAEDPLMAFAKPPPRDISFLNAAALTRPRLADRDEVLPLSAARLLVDIFAISTIETPYAGIDVVKRLLEPTSLADFAWSLFEQWQAFGAPNKESWVLQALGLVGNDEVARRLTPLIRAWPGESQHQRAVVGLDVLVGIGTDVALMHLNAIAQKVKFKGIKNQAQERMARLAEALELTKEQLADRLVPDLGLEADGSMVLDYGPRKFIVGFDEALKPFVTDEAGKRKKSLPKPGAKDDEARAVPAEARFKQLKKDARTLAGLQILRLEQAMVVGRRWTAEEFRTFLVAHPLLIHLVRRLVWAVYEDDAVRTFRVTEDSTLADVQDDDFSIDDAATIGIPHPIDMPAGAAESWGEILSDYELLQPFSQLGRPIHRLSKQELESRRLDRHHDAEVPVGRVLGLMNKGWERGEAQDGGVVHWVSLPLPDGKHEVRLWLGGAGIWTGMVSEQDGNPTIDGVTVVQRGQWGWNDNEGVMAFGELPSSLTSDIIDTLDALVNP